MSPSSKKENSALIASLACLSVAATSTVLGGSLMAGAMPLAATVINSLAGNLSINIASDQLLKSKLPTLRRNLIPKAPDASNHDLQIGLLNSLKNALAQCFADYQASLDPQKDTAHIRGVARTMTTLLEEIEENFLRDHGNAISEQAILDFDDNYENQMADLLVDYLNIERFTSSGAAFYELLSANLPLMISAAFVEELKQNPRCWIAYQRSILIDLRTENAAILEVVDDSAARLEAIQAQLNTLHTASGFVDDATLKTLVSSNTEVFELMSSSFSLLEGYHAKLTDRLSRLEATIHGEFRRQEDLLITNQRILQDVHASLIGGGTTGDLDRLQETVLPDYLAYLVREYETINLPSIRNEQKSKSIPLEQIYVALQFANDKTSKDFAAANYTIRQKIRQQELNAERELSTGEKDVIQAKVMQQNLTLRNFDHSSLKDGSELQVSLANVIQNNRYSVFLGDPGSGKSTIVKWLALQTARAYTGREGDRVVVAQQHIDCCAEEEERAKDIDLGPWRLPVVINISEYAKFFEANSGKGKCGLIDFCGHHLDTVPGLATADLHRLIKHYLANDQALILLDGMDEVVRFRDEILIEIRKFIRYWIDLGEYVTKGRAPAKEGGNQIVITSRIVGYHAAPLDEEVEEFYVRAMEEEAIKTFCRLWMKHTLAGESDQGDPSEEAEGLIAAIFDERQPRIRDLATNPLLITILALLYRSENKSLPRNRVELYQRAIQILMGKWTKLHMQISPLDVEELMEEVATAIHSSPSEVITEHDLQMLLERTLLKLRPEQTDGELRAAAQSFIRVIRQDVGLLSERGHKLYHFLHRTFQEYLAARRMVRKPSEAGREILDKISDPVWREPLIMAVSYANMKWSPQRFDELIAQIVAGDDPLRDLVPRAPLLIASALPDMSVVRPALFEQLLRQFLGAFGDQKGVGRFPAIQQKIKTQINALRNSEHLVMFYDACDAILEARDYGTIQWTLLKLATNGGWQRPGWLASILPHKHEDPAAFNFPIDHYLLLSFGQEDQNVENQHLRFRHQLTERPELVQRIQDDPAMLRLVSCLFGGWQYDAKLPLLKELDEIKTGLLAGRFSTEDGGYTQAVRLDTELGLVQHIRKFPLEFAARFIYRDAFCARRILKCLISGRPATSLISYFKEVYQDDPEVDRRALALLSLAALGENVAAEIYNIDATMHPDRYGVAVRFLEHLSRVERSLAVPLQAFVGNAEDIRFLRGRGWGDYSFEDRGHLLRMLAKLGNLANRIAVFGTPGDTANYLSDQESALYQQNPEVFRQRAADAWVGLTFPRQEDQKYSVSVVLDCIGGEILKADQVAVLCTIPDSPLLDSPHNFHWRIPRYLPEPHTERARLITSVRLLNEIGDDFNNIRSFLTYAVWKRLDMVPGLKTMALAAFIGRQSQLSRKLGEEYLGSFSTIEMLLSSCRKIEDPFVRFQCAHLIDKRAHTFAAVQIMVEALPEIYLPEEKVIAYLLANDVNLYGRLRYLFIGEDADGKQRVYAAMLSGKMLDDRELLAIIESSNRVAFRAEATLFALDLAEDARQPELMKRIASYFPKLDNDEQRGKLLRRILRQQPLLASKLDREDWAKINTSFIHLRELNRSLGKEYQNLFAFQDKDDIDKALVPLSLQLMSLELRERFRSRSIDDLLLNQMKVVEPDRAAFSQFLDRNKDGIAISIPLVECLDYFADNGNERALKTITPLVESHKVVDLRLVEHWEGHANQTLSGLHALLQAERSLLTPDILDHLIRIIADGDDRSRQRAKDALIGRNNGYNKRDCAYRASSLGYDYLIYKYKRGVELTDESPQIAQVLSWSHENIIDDDPKVINQAVQALKENPEKDSLALRRLLRSSNRPSQAVLDAIVDQLRTADPILGDHLWFAMSVILRRIDDLQLSVRFSNDQLEELLSHEAALNSLDYFEKHNLDTELAHLTEALLEVPLTGNQSIGERAAAIVTRTHELGHLGLTKLTSDIPTLRKCLKELGIRHYVFPTDRTNHIKSVLPKLLDKEGPLKLLLRVATIRLEEDLIMDKLSPIGADTLEVISAWSLEQPDFVGRHLAGSRLEGLLSEAIRYHQYFTGRQAGAEIIGRLGLISPAALKALSLAVRDVDYVRNAAISAIEDQGGDLNARALERLESYMVSESADLAAATSKLFAKVSNHPSVAPELRRSAMTKLAAILRRQIQEPEARKYLYEPTEVADYKEASLKISTEKNLEDILYAELIQLTGLD